MKHTTITPKPKERNDKFTRNLHSFYSGYISYILDGLRQDINFCEQGIEPLKALNAIFEDIQCISNLNVPFYRLENDKNIWNSLTHAKELFNTINWEFPTLHEYDIFHEFKNNPLLTIIQIIKHKKNELIEALEKEYKESKENSDISEAFYEKITKNKALIVGYLEKVTSLEQKIWQFDKSFNAFQSNLKRKKINNPEAEYAFMITLIDELINNTNNLFDDNNKPQCIQDFTDKLKILRSLYDRNRDVSVEERKVLTDILCKELSNERPAEQS